MDEGYFPGETFNRLVLLNMATVEDKGEEETPTRVEQEGIIVGEANESAANKTGIVDEEKAIVGKPNDKDSYFNKSIEELEDEDEEYEDECTCCPWFCPRLSMRSQRKKEKLELCTD
ncbi:hypothetical protein XENTR_v10017301 [Xenopus tropicalis]|nr:hypothetical protein XENTR_v10017301 [Xenopus tropicalis]